MGWEKLAFWKDNGKGFKIDVSKKAENYYSVLKVDEEIILTIISPPSSFDIDTSVGGEGEGSAIGSVKAGFNVKRDKNAQYKKPIILFKKDNKAGLDIETALGSFKSKISEGDNQEKSKINIESLQSTKGIIPMQKKSAVTVDAVIVDQDEKNVVLRPNVIISSDVKECLELLLESTIMSLGLDEKEGTYRTNIMLYNPEKNNLKIVASYNMRGHVDENFELELNQGGAGTAFSEKEVHFVDLLTEEHEKYGVNSKTVWDKMKGILSVRISDVDGNAIGVLNIDSDQGYQIAGFHEDKMHRLLRMQAQIIAKILE